MSKIVAYQFKRAASGFLQWALGKFHISRATWEQLGSIEREALETDGAEFEVGGFLEKFQEGLSRTAFDPQQRHVGLKGTRIAGKSESFQTRFEIGGDRCQKFDRLQADPDDRWPSRIRECSNAPELYILRGVFAGGFADCAGDVVDLASLGVTEKLERDVKSVRGGQARKPIDSLHPTPKLPQFRCLGNVGGDERAKGGHEKGD